MRIACPNHSNKVGRRNACRPSSSTPHKFSRRCIQVRASQTEDDYEKELREQIRILAKQGWTFKKPPQAATANQAASLKATQKRRKPAPELELVDDEAVSDPIEELAGVAGAKPPVLQPPPRAPVPTAAAQPIEASPPPPSPPSPSPSPTPTPSSPVPPAVQEDVPVAGPNRLGFTVATGTDLSSLTKSIISTLSKDDGCWVAAASPDNCTLALQAITSARKAAIHAGLFEITLQPTMTPQPGGESKLEFFLSKFELDDTNETLVEGATVYPGQWPADDEEFGNKIAAYLHEEQQVILRCGGTNHSSQAARALVIAQQSLQKEGLELQVSPEWHVSDKVVKLDLLVEMVEVEVDDEDSV